MNETDPDWTALLSAVGRDSESFGRYLESLDSESRFIALRNLLFVVTRSGFESAFMKRRLFDIAETFGLHFLPTHFYSPLPVSHKLPHSVFEGRFDTRSIDFRFAQQRQLLADIGRFSGELADLCEDAGKDGQYFWRNSAFGPCDTASYYGLVRTLRPRTIVEIGAGYSTLIACQAAALNGDTTITCVDPFPPPFLKDVPSIELIEQRVQDVDLELFSRLSGGDILFIDSTHVSKIGSDVNHLIFNVLPRLSKGVWIHFHDIFLPFEYPEGWVRGMHLFWNEQYLLLAFLSFNEAFQVELSNFYWYKEDRTYLLSCYPAAPSHLEGGPGSFWIRKVS